MLAFFAWLGCARFRIFAKRMAQNVLGRAITVKFCATPHHLGAASYGPGGELVFQ
jgi:hypothetical protein